MFWKSCKSLTFDSSVQATNEYHKNVYKGRSKQRPGTCTIRKTLKLEVGKQIDNQGPDKENRLLQ